MSKLESFKHLFLRSFKSKNINSSSENKTLSTNATNTDLDENDVAILKQWLDALNRQKSIILTEQNDIVIMPSGQHDDTQQILISCNDIKTYMKSKTSPSRIVDEIEIIEMLDVARILLLYGYVDDTEGGLSLATQVTTLDNNQLAWLTSIVLSAQPDSQSYETHVKLFDGESAQSLRIPYEHMSPTVDKRMVAMYLMKNGRVRYDVDTGDYAYRYIEPDSPLSENISLADDRNQRQLLISQIRQIHTDAETKQVEIEFVHEPTQRLVLPVHWYNQISAHHFDRSYIVDKLLKNGGMIERNNFSFMNHSYRLQAPRTSKMKSRSMSSTDLTALQLASEDKHNIMRRYVEWIIKEDCMGQDDTNNLLLIINNVDNRRLYFTSEHSDLIRKNRFQRKDVIYLLADHGQLKQDKLGHWFLYYNKQYIQLPPVVIPSSSNSTQNMNRLFHSMGKRLCIAQQMDA